MGMGLEAIGVDASREAKTSSVNNTLQSLVSSLQMVWRWSVSCKWTKRDHSFLLFLELYCQLVNLDCTKYEFKMRGTLYETFLLVEGIMRSTHKTCVFWYMRFVDRYEDNSCAVSNRISDPAWTPVPLTNIMFTQIQNLVTVNKISNFQ